jgi:hypothetical protein
MAGEPVVIELGTGHGAVDDDASPPGGRRRVSARLKLAVASGLLVLGCAAAAPAHPPLRDGPTVPAPVGAVVSVTGDTVVVSDPTFGSPDPGTTLTAYDLPSGAPRWSVTMPMTAIYTAERAGDVFLITRRDELRRRAATTAVAADTGEVRWRRPGAVLTAAGSAFGLAVSEVDGVSGRGWRVQGAVVAVDLATGRPRWHMDVPSTAVVRVTPDPAAALIIHDSGRFEVRDLAGGALRAARQMPPADYAEDNPRITGGVLVLRHYQRAGAVLTGYDLGTLAPRWELLDQAREARWVNCPGGLCARTPADHWTLDPADGRLSWQRGDGQPWRAIRGSDDQLLVRDLDDQRTLVASEVARAAPQVVGALPPGVGDCRAGAATLVCRSAVDADGLAVYRLSPP